MSEKKKVKYSDEEEYINKAKGNALENKNIALGTAGNVKDASYAVADKVYDSTEASADVAKKRNLADADSAYKLSEIKYGAEAEAMAGSGLGASGMNEYRSSQAYAQNRADRQASYAEYDRVMREAADKRDTAKLNADLTYAAAEGQAKIDYNNTMMGIAKEELGYKQLESAAIDSSYNSFIAGINDGSMTLSQIQADSYWSKLSPDQQAAVERAVTVKGLKTKIDNGMTLEEIESSNEYLSLSSEERSAKSDAQMEIANYFASEHAKKTQDANAAVLDYLTMADNGSSLAVIKAVAEQNGHLEYLENTPAWEALIDEIDRFNTSYDNASVEGYTSMEEVEKYIADNGIDSESERAENIITSWQDNNAKTYKSGLLELGVANGEYKNYFATLDDAVKERLITAEQRKSITSHFVDSIFDEAVRNMETEGMSVGAFAAIDYLSSKGYIEKERANTYKSALEEELLNKIKSSTSSPLVYAGGIIPNELGTQRFTYNGTDVGVTVHSVPDKIVELLDKSGVTGTVRIGDTIYQKNFAGYWRAYK